MPITRKNNQNIEVLSSRIDTTTNRLTISLLKKGRPSKRITLRSTNQQIESARVIKHDKKGDSELIPTRINIQNSYGELRLHFDQIIYPGRYTLELNMAKNTNKQDSPLPI